MQKINFSSFYKEVLSAEAIRIGDRIQVIPPSGKRSEFELNRTFWEFSSDDMPFLEDFSCDLQWHGITTTDELGYFILKAKDHCCFLLNGQPTREAILLRGDVLDIGHCRWIFKKLSPLKKVPDVLLSERIVRSNLPVLIEGETGTGKTTLAKKVHEQSGVAGEFVHINLGAFSPALLESEIFGHVRGAFTGAIQSKRGAIAEADRGTLFLDEIDSMPLNLQMKLLLFLDDQVVRPVGADHTIKVNTRLLFASGKNLLEEVNKMNFRKDLYYRLNSGIRLQLPTLRDDKRLIERCCREFGEKENVFVTRELVDFYKGCDWPGNFRELTSHLRKKKYSQSSLRLTFDEFDEALSSKNICLDTVGDSGFEKMEVHKKKYIHQVLSFYRGSIVDASKVLGVSYNTVKAYAKSS
jgi:transcriptional regulator with PAS, ATPase and Fis domain